MTPQTESIRIRTTPEFKTQLENACQNLDMTMSELIRDAVNDYISERASQIVKTFEKRVNKLLKPKKIWGDHNEKLEVMELITSRLDAKTMQTLGDPELIDDSTFETVALAKLEVAKRSQKEAVTA